MKNSASEFCVIRKYGHLLAYGIFKNIKLNSIFTHINGIVELFFNTQTEEDTIYWLQLVKNENSAHLKKAGTYKLSRSLISWLKVCHLSQTRNYIKYIEY